MTTPKPPMPPVNYDEKQVPGYELPDLLQLPDRAVGTAFEWMKYGRNYWLAVLERELYGKIPPPPDSMQCTVLSEKSVFHGRGIRREIRLDFSRSDGRTHSFHALLYRPSGEGPFPVFCGLNFQGNYTTTAETDIPLPSHYVNNNLNCGVTGHRACESARGNFARRWPFEQIIAGGCAVLTGCYGELYPDHPNGFRESIYRLFYDDAAFAPEASPLPGISAWSWGLSRLADLVERSGDLDVRRMAVFGHSRLGKTALWAGANDQRFGTVISNDSGCCGAALSRRKFGETYELMRWNEIEYWFADAFAQYIGREETLPFDQHALLALAAPRALYVASASEDLWADPYGEFLALRAAGKVYELFGARLPERFPAPGEGSMADCGYHLRAGEHEILAFDWERYLGFFNR